jgi:hypothetical protein
MTEVACRTHSPDYSPTGPWDIIVGVVGDVKQTSLAVSQSDAVYVTTAQWLWADGTQWLVVRAHGKAAALTPAVRKADPIVALRYE